MTFLFITFGYTVAEYTGNYCRKLDDKIPKSFQRNFNLYNVVYFIFYPHPIYTVLQKRHFFIF